MESGDRDISNPHIRIMSSSKLDFIDVKHIDHMNHFICVIGYTFKDHEVRNFSKFISWQLILNYSQENILVIKHFDIVWVACFAEFTFQRLPVKSLRNVSFFSNFSAVEPFLQALEMHVLHGTRAFARGKQRVVTLLLFRETYSAKRKSITTLRSLSDNDLTIHF